MIPRQIICVATADNNSFFRGAGYNQSSRSWRYDVCSSRSFETALMADTGCYIRQLNVNGTICEQQSALTTQRMSSRTFVM